MNGILVKGDAAGVTMYYGAGAGSEQTASAVIADLVDVARLAGTQPAQRVPHLGFHAHAVDASLTVLPRRRAHATTCVPVHAARHVEDEWRMAGRAAGVPRAGGAGAGRKPAGAGADRHRQAQAAMDQAVQALARTPRGGAGGGAAGGELE